MASPIPVFHSPEYQVDIGIHVFPTVKFAGVRRALLDAGDIEERRIVDPGPANRATLELAHTAAYLDDLEMLRWTPRTQWSELPLTAEIVRAYVIAAQGTYDAALAALASGSALHLGGGFHHAFAERAEGFCYVNDLAVAVRALQRDGRIRRAAVVDLDVHQGNGTARIFHGDPDVFTLSIHQEANYPVPKQPSDLDVGLDDGTGDEEYEARLRTALQSVWESSPEIVLYQAGADPFEEDVLGGLKLTKRGLETRDRLVLEGCAARGIPSVVTLGGGYARRVEDTIDIHARTCRIAAELVRSPAGRRA